MFQCGSYRTWGIHEAMLSGTAAISCGNPDVQNCFIFKKTRPESRSQILSEATSRRHCSCKRAGECSSDAICGGPAWKPRLCTLTLKKLSRSSKLIITQLSMEAKRTICDARDLSEGPHLHVEELQQ